MNEPFKLTDSLLELLPDIWYRQDLDGFLIGAGSKLSAEFGFCFELDCRVSLGKLFSNEEAFRYLREQAIKEGRVPVKIIEVKDAHGADRIVSLSAQLVEAEKASNGVGEIVGVIRDVTNHLDEIREEQETFLNFVDVINSTLDGMVIIDIETRKIVDANQVALDFAGYSLHEIKNIPLNMLVQAEEQEFYEFISVLKKQGDFRFNRRLVSRVGDFVDLEVSARMMHLGDGQFFQCNVRDITLKKRLYKFGRLRGEILRMKETGRQPEEIIANLCKQLETICPRAGFAYLSFDPQVKWVFANQSNIPINFQFLLSDCIRSAPELTLQLRKQAFNADMEFFLKKMKLDEKQVPLLAQRWSVFSVFKGNLQDGTLVVFDQSQKEMSDEELDNLGQLAHILGNTFHKIDQEQRLLDSEYRYRELVDHSPLGIGVYQDGKIVFANHEFHNMLGFAPGQEITAEDLVYVVPPETIEEVLQLVDLIQETGQIPITELTCHKFSSREEVTIMVQGTAVSYKDREAMQFVFYDITERKRFERELKESKKKFELAAEGSEAGIVDHYDLQNGFMWWSPKVYELLEYENKEILSNAHVFRELIHPEDLIKLREMLGKNIHSHRMEYRLRTKSGRYKWFLGSGKALLNEHGHPIRIVGAIIDIDQRKIAEQKLRDRERLLHTTGLVAKVGGWQIERKGKVLTWTDQTYNIYGISNREEISLDMILAFYSDNDRAKISNAIDRCFEGEPFELTCRLKSRSGKLLWVDFSGMPVYENGEIVKLTGAQRDLTHYIHQIEGIRANEKKLRNANQLAGLGNWEWNLETDSYFFSEHLYNIVGIEKTRKPTIELIDQVIHADSKESFSELVHGALAGQPSETEELTIVQKSTGDIKYISVRAVTERNEKGRVTKVLGTVLDITERRKMEMERERRNLYSNVVLELNAIASQAKNNWALSKAYCIALVKQIGFDWVWIADQGNVGANDFNPFSHEFSARLTDVWGSADVMDAENGMAAEKAFKQGKMLVIPDIKEAKGLAAWRKKMTEAGFQTYISIPFNQGTKIQGTVNLYSLDKIEVDDSLKKFLTNLINDYGNSIYAIELKRNRDELNEFNKMLLDSLDVVSFSFDAYSKKVSVFGDTERLIGYDNEQFKKVIDSEIFIHPNDLNHVQEQIDRTKDGGGTYDIEYRIRKPEDGSIIWVSSIGMVYWQKDSIRRVIGILMNINQRKQAELDNVKAQINVRDNERIRIARSIHDSLGQTLTIASMSLDALSPEISKLSTDRQELFRDAYDQLTEAMEEARSISHNLMPSLLMDFGLVKSIRSDVNKLNRSGKVHFTFEYDEACDQRYAQEIEVNFYNITKEAITNMLKHSKATEAVIQLRESNELLSLYIHDNGVGYDSSKVRRKDGLGLGSIESRAISIGADVYMDGDDGATIRIALRLDK